MTVQPRKGEKGSGFAEFFREGFAVGQGDGVEPAEDLQVDDEGDDREGEEDGDHEPGTIEVVAEEEDDGADRCAGDDHGEGEESA